MQECSHRRNRLALAIIDCDPQLAAIGARHCVEASAGWMLEDQPA
jgi:hypothetical protein